MIITLFMYACMRTLYNACKCRLICGVSLRRAASHIIGNYNYLCSVPPCGVPCVLCAYCVTWYDEQITTRSIFVFVVFRTESPPPQTKTLKTKRVFLYRMLRFCSSVRR